MMNCTKCGNNDALALFSSVLCVNSTCDFYDEGYSIEKGYSEAIEKGPPSTEGLPGDIGPSSAAGVIGVTSPTGKTGVTGSGGFSIIIADEYCRRTGNPRGSVIGIPCDCASFFKLLLQKIGC